MSNIRFVNLASHTTPQVVEDKRKEWVGYGADNNYFQYLIDRYNGSTTNNAILNGITELIYGRGLSAFDADRKPEAYAKAVTMFNKKVLRRLIFDVKAMGQGALQLIYNQDKSKIVKVEHMPIETLRFEKMTDKGDCEAFYYSKDWSKVNHRDYKPVRIPAFGFGSQSEKLEILYIKPYRAGFYYYSPVDYQGGLPYAELEEEVANYHINNIKNGLAPSMLINFNNGRPSEEEQDMIERSIANKFSGTNNAGKFILSFNDNKELAATIDPVQLSDASDQYQFLADESSRKLMVAHRITSPMLLGIKDNTGFGNNAEEIESASLLFYNTVIRPIQEMILDSLDEVLAYNQESLKLYFKSLQPLEFYEDITPDEEEEQAQEEPTELSAEDWLQEYGEVEDLSEYELIDQDDESTEEEPEDFDVESYLNGLVELSAGQDSSQDDKIYKVRYAYVKGTSKTPVGETRSFCRSMLTSNKVYRKEDINMMSTRGVNKEFGHKGRNYSIFKYKGGPSCYHRWERRIYKKKIRKDGEPYAGDALKGTNFINVNQAVRQGFKLPQNPSEVPIAPIDMPNQGHHPNYNK